MECIKEKIVENARRLKKLEKDFLRFTFESKSPETSEERKNYFSSAIKLAAEAAGLENEIILAFEGSPNLRIIDSEVKDVLSKIRRRKNEFYSIRWYKSVLEQQNIGKAEEDKFPITLTDLIFSKFDDYLEDFHSWFDLSGFYERRIKIGPIISSSDLPENMEQYFSEIKMAYAYRLYKSCTALCRALLEMALFEKLKRKGLLKETDQRVTDIYVVKQDKLNNLIWLAFVNGLLPREKKERAHKIQLKANKILHLKSDGARIPEQDAFEIICDTVDVLEHLYK